VSVIESGHYIYVDRDSRTGGNVDVMDEDGDTPLYTVENVDTARWLVEHGASVHHRNNEGVSVSFIHANRLI
jgi:hypothetical protein